ncbi:MAG: hypothetical protein COZ18_15595 [Flexibacter sp. CG_4_10_14_3_um_filter_32_15]|nr:MAG: hypothetical protein COZ18_15595 [Flexibacter sp. CG_4_10_14_3_um_filter_32_15]
METYKESIIKAQAKLKNVPQAEIKPRKGVAPAFIMRVMLTSLAVFFVAIGIEIAILHSIIANPEVELGRRIVFFAVGGGLLGATIGMITSFAFILKKKFDYKNAMSIMAVVLVLLMIGVAILGDYPI